MVRWRRQGREATERGGDFARSGRFTGRDIAAAGIQVCGGSRYDLSFPRGLQLWDVTDPANPEELGFWDSECCTRGVHEFEIEHRPDLRRTFAYATVPTSRYPDETTPSGYRDADGDGDFRLIDITDPAHPFQVSANLRQRHEHWAMDPAPD